MLLVMVTLLTASVARRPPAPATGIAGPASQDQPKNSATGPVNASRRKIPCKTPENASLCYWTHGRLSFYEDYPPLRIWKIGADRLLGVFSGPSGFPPRDNRQLFLPELPANLARIYEDRGNWEPPIDDHVYYPADVFADFNVCPLIPEKKGKMQPICIESAKNIFVQR
jgi:hypothetical protein